MCKGEKSTVIISPDYAYGDEGIPDVVPAKAVLIFQMHLVNFFTPM
jgi:FKBP-type peptidyl-prolyl cis-trans isomerase